MRTRLFVITLALGFAAIPVRSTPQTGADTGTVSGCITDTTGQLLPGVTVDVGKVGQHHIVFSNSAGCYVVTDLPRGSYFVFARLPGFVSMTRDQLNIEPGRSETVNFQMRIPPMCECISLGPLTLAKLWLDADAVIRVRIAGHDPDAPRVKHIATVLQVLKRDPTMGASDKLTFVQGTERDEVEPYAVGQDFVIFLQWSSASRVFVRWSDGDGIVGAFAIEDGRIHSGPIARDVGMDVGQFLSELEPLSRQ